MTVHHRLDSEQALRHLPGLPMTPATALAELRGADVSRARVAEILQQDAGVAARLERVLESSFFATGEPLDGLSAACRQLPVKSLERAVIASAVLGQFPGGRGYGLDRDGFWEHSVGVGVIARTLADSLGENAELAFTGGLLHDIGRIVLDVYFPREFLGVLRYQGRHDTWIRDAELAVLGFDHCRIGGRVARHWGLPEDLTEVIRCHHQPDGAGVRHAATLIVHLADVLARGLEFGDPGDDTIPLLSQVAMKRLGLNWEALRVGLQQVEGQLPEARRLVHATIGADASASA